MKLSWIDCWPGGVARSTLAVALFLSAMTLATSASALDGYKDRRGVFAGVGIGGGTGAANVENPMDITGLDTERALGLQLSATLGGGVYEFLTIAAQGNWWIRTVAIGDRRLNHQHLSFLPVANVFVFDGLYGLGGVGLAYARFDAERGGVELRRYREMGLAAKVGAGYEFFLNGTVAAGFEAAYTRHFYGNAEFDTLNGAITLRWY